MPAYLFERPKQGFAVPWAVVNDARFLESQDVRSWRAGIAEAFHQNLQIGRQAATLALLRKSQFHRHRLKPLLIPLPLLLRGFAAGAAEAADFVFARVGSSLVGWCRERGVPHRVFATFHEVIDHFPA